MNISAKAVIIAIFSFLGLFIVAVAIPQSRVSVACATEAQEPPPVGVEQVRVMKVCTMNGPDQSSVNDWLRRVGHTIEVTRVVQSGPPNCVIMSIFYKRVE